MSLAQHASRNVIHNHIMNEKSSVLYLMIALVVFSAAIIGLIVGCDEKTIDTPILGPASGSGPVGGGESQKIRLSASPSKTIEVPSGEQGTVTITARIENNIGQPMPDGQSVIWSSTVGTLSATVGSTSNGTASVTLTFPKNYVGCSTVSARSGDATASIEVCAKSGGAGQEGLIVKSKDEAIAATGQTEITATVYKDGEPQQNVQVNFTVSGAGTLNASGAFTNSGGEATVTLKGNNTNTSQSSATVTATTLDGQSGSVTVTIYGVGQEPTPTPVPTATPGPTATPTTAPTTAIRLIVDNTTLNASNAPSPNQTLLRAYVTDNGTAQTGVTVFFTFSGLSGTTLSNNTTTSIATGFTNPDSTLNVSTTSPPVTGATVTVRAERLDTGQTDTVQVEVFQ
jgi:hypothetical protein